MSPIKKGNYALAKEPDSPAVQDDEIEEERNSGSDEDDEDEEENPEELADFIVGDDFEEEDGEDDAPPIQDDDQEGGRVEEEDDGRHEKRKKHRKKKKEMELDEDDLELIQENEGNEGRHHKKLKKTKEIAKSRYDYDDELVKEVSIGEGQNDFIEEDAGEEAEEERYRPRRSAKRGDNSALFSIFGGGFEPEPDDDYGNERGMEEEDDLPEEDRRAMLKKKYELMFDPGELQDKFATFADEQIVTEDVPERLQLRYKGRFCDNNELVLETNWIGDKLMLSKGLMDKNSDNFRKNIMKVLEFLRINFFEIMYIHTYKANEISLKPGELKLQDLWRIYDLDIEWTGIYSRRKLVEKSLAKIHSFTPVPPLINHLFNTSFDKIGLDNLLDFTEYLTLVNPEISQIDENPERIFKKSSRLSIKPEFKVKFDSFIQQYLTSADQFAENLHENKMKHMPPYVDLLLTDVTQQHYVDENIPRLNNSEAFLLLLCEYVARELFYHPVIRKVVYRQYFEKIVVSTEPTQKGKKEMDIYNINYAVKRIDCRPLKDIEDEVWLRAVQNEKEGKIKIKFHFRWKDFSGDEIHAYLKNFYLYDAKIKNEASTQWNILRTEVINVLLKSMMYPYLEKLTRQDLTENAEKKVIQECGKKFKEMISAAPYMKSKGDDVISDITVMSFIPEQDNKVTCAVVNQYGEYQAHKTYNYLLVSGRAPEEYKTKQTIEEGDLKGFVERHKPDLLVVGADNLTAKSLVKYLRDQQSQRWEEEYRDIWVKYGDMTAPKIYAKMEVSQKELPDFPARLKESISLARLQQSPLHEILKLWHHRQQENGILYIILHDLQAIVDQEKLVQELEKSAIEVTNQVGVAINRILSYPHLNHPFQFVCGLGPRKAKAIYDNLRSQKLSLKSRRDFKEDNVVSTNIFTNMAGFIKVLCRDENLDDRDLLDTTRIHPNDYRLAQKIARDALDDVENTEDYIKTIMDKPQKLDDLDLDDYATHLETKGKSNMKIVLDFIVSELTRPFADPRGDHKEMDPKELFYKMTKMHPFDLQNGSLVSARITRVTEKNIICRLECGIEGNIFIQDVFEGKEAQQSLPQKFHDGQVVSARVVGTNFDDKAKRKEEGHENKTVDFTKLHLLLKPTIVNAHEKFLKELHPSTVQTFKVVPEEDFPIQQTGTAKQVRYYTRKINHPKFKNASAYGALNYLEDKENGDFVVRPSSRGMDHLTLTWKFFGTIYVHLDIKESGKGPGDRIGRRLQLKDQIYENIDELAAGYVYPCNSFVKSIESSNKFVQDNPSRIEEIIKQEKEENPKLIPYRFGFSTEAPQFLVLYYAPKDYNVIKEYIKVKPSGLFFHEKIFQDLPQLVSWFKTNYHRPEYHKYLKVTKPPVALPKQPVQVKGEKTEPNLGGGINTPTHLGRAFDDKINVKTERPGDIYVKQEKGMGGGFNKDDDRGFNRGGFNRQDRGGRPYHGDQDRNKFNRDNRDNSRDFNRDRPPRRDRSRSREKERDRDRERSRDFRGGDNRGDNRGGNDRFNNRDRPSDRGGRRDFSDNRRRDDRSRDDKGGRRDFGGRSPPRQSPGWGKSSPGWGQGMQEEQQPPVGGNDNWGAQQQDGGWGGNQPVNVKDEYRAGSQQQPQGWGGDDSLNMPPKVKEEQNWGGNPPGNNNGNEQQQQQQPSGSW